VRPVTNGDTRMALDDHTVRVSSPISRRSIVRTGVKLAYATPLVAASMRIGAETVGAVSGDGCPECYVFSTDYGRCIREAVLLVHGECPCGFDPENDQCVKDGCRDCFDNVGGICVPELVPPANGRCQCGFEEFGGICVPRYPDL
jgi:hypothetical protein